MKFQIKSVNARLFAYFCGLSFFGSLMFMLPFLYKSGKSMAYIDSLFTAISAVCVTGLCTIDMEIFNNAGLFVLLLLIETGGLGLVTFFSLYLVFPSQKISLVNRRILREYFIYGDDLNVWLILLKILGITFGCQAAGGLVLGLILRNSGEDNWFFYGFFLAVSSFCNAGFSPYSESLKEFSGNNLFLSVVAILIILGGLGFSVITSTFRWLWNKILWIFSKNHFNNHRAHRFLSLHTKIVLWMTLILTLGGTVLTLAIEWERSFSGMKIGQKIANAFFQSVTLRTAGFEAVSQGQLSKPTLFSSLFLMLCGGSPGSMAGGLKTTTLFLVLCFTFRNSCDKDELTVFKKDISWETMDKASAIFAKGMCLLALCTFALCLAETNSGFSIFELCFESISAFCTVGLSVGITSQLSIAGKIVVMITMILGRTGVFAMSIGICRKKMLSLSDYPREDVLVG